MRRLRLITSGHVLRRRRKGALPAQTTLSTPRFKTHKAGISINLLETVLSFESILMAITGTRLAMLGNGGKAIPIWTQMVSRAGKDQADVEMVTRTFW